jgi:hypothetical protein
MRTSLRREISLVMLWIMAATVQGELPESAYISGVTNSGWEMGMCHVASFGQLIQFGDPNRSAYELVVRSGDTTQAAWMRGESKKRIFLHPRWLDAGSLVDVARLCGVGLHVGYGEGKGSAMAEAKAADSVTVFHTEEEAIHELKTLIAAGIPIQVHMDMYYLWGGDHGNHRIVVHGYDPDFIYYTDNGGESGTKENIALTWEDFLNGWSLTPLLSPRFPARPYFLCYITDVPCLADDAWTLVWLALDAFGSTRKVQTGPEAIRELADALREGADPEDVFDGYMRGVFDNQRPYFADYLESLDLVDLANTWREACAIWESLFQPDWPAVPNLLDDIADKEESVLLALAELYSEVDPIVLFSPLDAEVVNDLEGLTFQWLPLPGITDKIMLEFAPTGDFNDADRIVRIKAKSGQTHLQVSSKDWLKILSKDDGDQHLCWRVVGAGKTSDQTSGSRDLYWNLLEMTALTPADDTSISEGEAVLFSFSAPSLAQKPIVQISTTGDFHDKKRLLTLKVKKGQSQTVLMAKNVVKLQKKDDGDNVVYWRVEDKLAQKSTVNPSEIRTFYLP